MAKKKESSDPSKIKLQPLGDRVVVERDESEKVTAGGIVLPDTAKDKPTRGKVVSVGDGRLLGQRHPQPVAGQGRQSRAVQFLCRRHVQARHPRAAAAARRGHSGRNRIDKKGLGIRDWGLEQPTQSPIPDPQPSEPTKHTRSIRSHGENDCI